MAPHTIIVALLAPLLFLGCNSLTSEERVLVGKLEALQIYPVPRGGLISSFDLEELERKRLRGGIRGGRAMQIETWSYPSGLEISGYNFVSVPVGNLILTDQAIDGLFEGGRQPKEVSHEITELAPIQHFQYPTLSKSGKTFFDSRLKVPSMGERDPQSFDSSAQ